MGCFFLPRAEGDWFAGEGEEEEEEKEGRRGGSLLVPLPPPPTPPPLTTATPTPPLPLRPPSAVIISLSLATRAQCLGRIRLPSYSLRITERPVAAQRAAKIVEIEPR